MFGGKTKGILGSSGPSSENFSMLPSVNSERKSSEDRTPWIVVESAHDIEGAALNIAIDKVDTSQ